MNTIINTPTARKTLDPRGRVYTYSIERGLKLGYRKLREGAGSWTAIIADHGKERFKAIGEADDNGLPANGQNIFSFAQAKDRAKKLSVEFKAGITHEPETLAQAIGSYREYLRTKGGKLYNADWLLRHVSPDLLGRSLAQATVKDFSTWQGKLKAGGMIESTINRLMKVARAALARAADNDPRIAANASAWKKGLVTYKGAKQARMIRLTDDQVRAIVAEAHSMSPAFGLFVEMHAVYGSRTSQLARITVEQLRGDRVEIPGDKKGSGNKRQPRSFKVHSPALLAALQAAASGQPAGTVLLRDENGQPWLREMPGRNEMEGDRHRVLFAQLARKLDLPTELRNGKECQCTLIILRHASIQRLLRNAIPPKEVADIHFTSIAEIERHYHYGVAHDDAAMAFDATPGYNVVHFPVSKHA